jgi:uncharacterized protein (DUF4415 family)
MKRKKDVIEKAKVNEAVDPEFDIDLSKAKIVPREKMKFAKPQDLEPRNTKLLMSIRLDLDIVAYFKRRAKKPFAAPYQTQINDVLRQFMEQHPN